MHFSLVDSVTLSVALAATVLALYANNRRGLIWLFALVADYSISTAYWRSGLGNPELATGLCDAAVCFCILMLAQKFWEFRIFVVFMASLVTNFLYLASNLTGVNFIDHEVYSIAEEALNGVAIFLIAFTSGAIIARETHGRSFHPWSYRDTPLRLVLRKTKDH